MYYLSNFNKTKVREYKRKKKDGSFSTVRSYLRKALVGGALLGTGAILGTRLVKPKEIIKRVEVPKESIKTKEVIRNVEVPKEVIKNIEVPKEVIKTVEIPKEVIRTVEVPKRSNVKRFVRKKADLKGVTRVTAFSVDDINFDPQRFQYKIVGQTNKTGSVGSLKGVKKYDHRLGGVIQVWREPRSKKVFVVNGHNRLAKAKELGEKKVAVMFLDAKTPLEAKTIGALTNIAEGQGTALDAGKFIRTNAQMIKNLGETTGKPRLVKAQTEITDAELENSLKSIGLKLNNKVAEDGLALAKLDPYLFNLTERGFVNENIGIKIGKSGLSKQKQRDFYDNFLSKNKKSLSMDQLDELLETLRYSEQNKSMSNQFDLFGNNEVITDNFVQRAKLQSKIKQEIRSGKRLFSTLGKKQNTTKLNEAGVNVNKDVVNEKKQQADIMLTWFERFKFEPEISNLLNTQATLVQQGKKTEAQAFRDIYEKVLQTIETKRSQTLIRNKQ